MITTLNTRKLLTLAGIFLLAAVAFFFPVDAFANDTVRSQTKVLAEQMSDIPKAAAILSYLVGTVFAIRALFALKGFIEAPDDNPITKVIGFGAVAALLILLPYIISLMAGSGGMENVTLDSSASSFTKGDANAGF